METTTTLTPERLKNSVLDVHESQKVFKTLIGALSNPGKIFHIDSQVWNRVDQGVISLLALLGHETPFCVVDPDSETQTTLVQRITTAKPVPLSEARYIAINRPVSEEEFSCIPAGTNLRPDLAAQVTVRCRGQFFMNQDGTRNGVTVQITGPGVLAIQSISFEYIDLVVLNALVNRPAEFPSGVDVWFVSESGQVVGIPRTSIIEIVNNTIEREQI